MTERELTANLHLIDMMVPKLMSQFFLQSGKTATAVFDFYESVIEADILNLTGIQVSLIKANGLRLSLNVCCKADLSALVSGDCIRCEKEDDEEYQHLVFEAKEGDRK